MRIIRISAEEWQEMIKGLRFDHPIKFLFSGETEITIENILNGEEFGRMGRGMLMYWNDYTSGIAITGMTACAKLSPEQQIYFLLRSAEII